MIFEDKPQTSEEETYCYRTIYLAMIKRLLCAESSIADVAQYHVKSQELVWGRVPRDLRQDKYRNY